MTLKDSIEMCLVALLMGNMSVALAKENILMYTNLEIDKCKTLEEFKERLKK